MEFFKPQTYKLFTYLNSQKFINKIQGKLTKKIPDDGLHGGGLSIMRSNVGKLNPHLDNSIHPKNGLLQYNLILFLNKNWQRKNGGCLNFYIKNNTNDKIHGKLSTSIMPIFNRCVIFDTSMNSWHSVEKLIKEKIYLEDQYKFIILSKKKINNKGLKFYMLLIKNSKKIKKFEFIKNKIEQ